MTDSVAITGMAVATAYGHGVEALLAGVLSGKPAFAPVSRFDVSGRRVGVAATMAGAPNLIDLLEEIIGEACEQAGLSTIDRANSVLHLAIHGEPVQPRDHERLGPHRVYTSACVAASQALADAAAMIALGDARRVIVAAGYLLEPYQFALFDAARALAADGIVRPFSLGRKGILLADGVAAIVLEAGNHASAPPLAHVSGWGRAGDAYHVVQPRPDGEGMARAISAALRRAGLRPEAVEYVNAHGSGSLQSDPAEANALASALGGHAKAVPVSSTKSLHGQSLEASPLVEIVTTVAAMREGAMPVTAGFLEADPACPLHLILDEPLAARPRHALSVNSAFGGANTALIVSAP